MSPRFEPDFVETQVSTPVYPKGTYEVSITRVNGAAWTKENDKTGESYTVRRIRARAKMKGRYDSEGKLHDSIDDLGEIVDKDVAPVDFYIHSEGAMRVAKSNLMAVLGFNPRENEDEEAFNEWVQENEPDFGFDETPLDDGSFEVDIGDGWKTMEGRDAILMLDVEMYKPEGADKPEKRQRIATVLPVGSV